MTDRVPRLRMFAGPNGSGKTTVKNTLKKPPEWFGVYINPDDLERQIKSTHRFPLSWLGMEFSFDSIVDYFTTSSFLNSVGLKPHADKFQQIGEEIDFHRLDFTSYHASVLSDYLRRRAILSQTSFSFETVMSSVDKIDFLRDAKQSGFRTYLYYVATEDPTINVQRVHHRVQAGGHHVPEAKILDRYRRSLELVPQAIRCADRAFFFDTSDEEAWYFAEVTNGNSLELKSDEIPAWFQQVWDQLST